MMMDRGLLDKQASFPKSSEPLLKEDYLVRVKIGGIIFFGVLSSFFLSYFFREFLIWGGSYLLYASIATAVFLVVFNLHPFFIKGKGILALAAFLESFMMAGIFADKLSWTLTITFLFIFLFLLSGLLNGSREAEESLKVRFWPVARLSVSKGLVAVSLFVSVLSVLYFQSDAGKFFISKETFGTIFSINAPLIQKIYPGIDPAMTSEAVAGTIVKNQLDRLPDFQSLPQKARQQEVKKQTNLLMANFSDYLGARINPNARLQDAVFEAVAQKYNALPEGIKTLILIGVGALIFLTIETLAWPVKVVIAALAFLVYEILITAGFANITVENRSKEVITLD